MSGPGPAQGTSPASPDPAASGGAPETGAASATTKPGRRGVTPGAGASAPSSKSAASAQASRSAVKAKSDPGTLKLKVIGSGLANTADSVDSKLEMLEKCLERDRENQNNLFRDDNDYNKDSNDQNNAIDALNDAYRGRRIIWTSEDLPIYELMVRYNNARNGELDARLNKLLAREVEINKKIFEDSKAFIRMRLGAPGPDLKQRLGDIASAMKDQFSGGFAVNHRLIDKAAAEVLAEVIKADIRARFGKPGLGPDFEKRVRNIVIPTAMSYRVTDEPFIVKVIYEIINELKNEAINQLDDVIINSFHEHVTSLNTEILEEEPLNLTSVGLGKYWQTYRTYIRGLKGFDAAVYAQVYDNAKYVLQTRPNDPSDIEIEQKIADELFVAKGKSLALKRGIYLAVLRISLEKSPPNVRARILMQTVLDERASYDSHMPFTHTRLAQLIRIYDPKLAQEIKSNHLYKETISNFVETCFKAGGSLQDYRDVIWQLDSAAQWIIEPDILRDMLAAADRYAADNFNIPEIRNKIKSLDASIPRAN